jgi:transaldolase
MNASMKSNMRKTLELGTDFWNDSCGLKELGHAVQEGAVGSTSNPVIVSTVIQQEQSTWSKVLAEIIQKNSEDTEDDLAWKLVTEIGKQAAALLEPVYQKTSGLKGYLSIQTNPKFYRNTQKMVAQAQELAKIAPNIAIKVPAVESGIRAMEELTADGIRVNATVSYSVAQAIACAEAFERGLDRAQKGGVDTTKFSPYVTLMVGRLDDQLRKVAEKNIVKVDPEFLHWAGIATFKKAYKIFQERNYRSTLLSAAYRNHLQWSELVGAKAVLTMPYAWWTQFNSMSIEVSSRIEVPVETKIVDTLYETFVDFRKAYDEKGMSISEFVSYPASVDTLRQFLGGYEKLLGVVRNEMLG